MIALADPPRAARASPLRAGESLPAAVFSPLRLRALLDGCKWDPQVGDVSSLAPFPLVLKSSEWSKISRQAEQLAAEAAAAEEEISRRPELLGKLGLPASLRRVLADKTPLTPTAGRVIRFDFHYTSDGWKISEANSDVPGGFSEASFFTSMIAAHFPNLLPAGDPSAAWSDVLANAAGPCQTVALLSAPGYMEDHQVIAFLAARLRERGCRTHLAGPEQLLWREGCACVKSNSNREPLGAIVKFYQAEWLSRLPEKSGWKYLFRGGKTPVANPALAVITESKRFPLVWDELSSDLPTWRALLPETRDPCAAPWASDDSWLLKTSMCNTGDAVFIRALATRSDWLKAAFAAKRSPGRWLAQRRFDSVPIRTPAGMRHVCVGVYTVNGRAAGAYARLSPTPVINYQASDAALLLEANDD